MKKPANWDIDKTMDLEFKLETSPLLPYYQTLRQRGWQFFAVNQKRGRCYYAPKFITIPLFAFNKTEDYLTWYVAHEMAHAFAGYKANHGPDFMAELKRICPKEAIYHELFYKPYNAIAAGITDLPY